MAGRVGGHASPNASPHVHTPDRQPSVSSQGRPGHACGLQRVAAREGHRTAPLMPQAAGGGTKASGVGQLSHPASLPSESLS